MAPVNGVEALAKYSEQSFDLILLDIMLPKLQAAPKNYQYDIEDVDLELRFLPDE